MTRRITSTGHVLRNSPVRQANLRAHNLGLVLRRVAESTGPVSRADVSAATGLTRATVSALVDDLVAGRLIDEVAPLPRTGAGRPGVGLVLAGDGPAGLGLEVNVDYLAACVVDLAGTVRHRRVARADQRPAGPDRTIADVAELAAAVRGQAEQDGLTVTGAALAVPGLVAADGIVRLAPNLDWHDVDVAVRLRHHPDLADLPVTVDNEANLAALGELHAAGAPASFLYVSGEIGVGAGIVLNGALYRGTRGFSGELGHLPVRPEGPICRCGARGCLERYAGQEAILRAAGLDVAGTPDTGAVAPALDRLAELAAAGDSTALHALGGAADALGTVLAGVINVLDVDAVLLGGAYAPLVPWLHPRVSAQIDRRVLTARWSPVTVRAARLAADAAMVGAAGSVVRAVRDDPAQWLATRPRV